MSFTFTIHLESLPNTSDVLALLPSHTAWQEELDPHGPWPEGFYHLYLPDLSTRTTEIGLDEGDFTIRIMTLACFEDMRLALDLVLGLAQSYGATITPEDRDTPLSTELFTTLYGDDWIVQKVQADVKGVYAMVNRDRQILAIPGPHRAFRFGPFTLEQMGGPHAEPLFTLIRQVQHPPEDRFVANTMVIRSDDGNHEATLVVLGPGVSYLLPPARYIALLDIEPIHVPFECILQLAPHHVTPLDDGHVWVDPIDDETFIELLDRAQPWVVPDPLARVMSGEPDGILLPVLRPAAWEHRDVARTASLFEDGQSRYPELPWVSYVMDTPRTMAIVPHEGFGPETADPEQTHTKAIANLIARSLTWDEDRDADGKLRGLIVTDEFAAELLLVPECLRDAQAQLGAELLLAAAPIRDLLRVQPGLPAEDAEEPLEPIHHLMWWARHVFEDAQAAGSRRLVSPYVFIVQDGRVIGLSLHTPNDELDGSEPEGI